ncbi:MAG: glycosyltransferase family 9 protein, partial [Janthinobacterium lividum]
RALQKVWSQLGRTRYDLVATLYYDRRYRLLSLPVVSRRHIRLQKDSRNLQLLHGRHHTDEFARILLSASRAADTGPAPHSLAPLRPEGLPASPLGLSSQKRVTLTPGGARNALRDDRLRRWQTSHYAELARLLIQTGHEVVLTGGPGDLWVREAFADLPCIDLIDQLTLPQLLALFDSSDAVVTHDSGPLHLAGVTSCALLGVFGPVDPWMRLPRRPGAVALWGGEGFACRPCYDGASYADCKENLCMAQITPEFAFDTLLRMLDQKAAGDLQPPAVLLPQSTAPLVSIATVSEPS